ncbi:MULTISPECIES: metalloregulator ArsR/SmtB family transcription factor [unclassified Endozoicomonas]|uniref:metalloregulator ArsR/SmtB family transcription factor n=1 Tax=unclassified Endozoicomonas TaxID=2644528 RepID=UPI002148CB86|nr:MULTISPECIES: metalloregulator ArsR/SmtB family transcription factor [unclassified Endozoicomonas]
MMTPLLSILFLCTGNSARSQLAEAIFRNMAGNDFRVFSAGTQPQGIDDRVFQTLKKRGIPTDGLKSESLEDLDEQQFDYVITLCDNAKNECAHYPQSDALLHWDLADPRQQDGLTPFDNTADILEGQIKLFLQLNTPGVIKSDSNPDEFFKLLSDNTRLRILMLIEDEHELCVNDLVVALQESQSKISRHLAQMRTLKILSSHRRAQNIFYRLNPELPPWMELVLAVTRTGQPDFINQEKIRLKAHASNNSLNNISNNTASANAGKI